MRARVTAIDSRDHKKYEGYLTTPLKVGNPATIELLDGKHELHITPIQRWLSIGSTYWVIDTRGVKFTLIAHPKPSPLP